MPYGILKADTITYYTATGDVSVAVSGIAIQGAPVISGVSGIFTASVSGATVTGNAGQFTTLTGGTAQFTSVTGVSGVFTTRISGATVTGDTGQFTTLTAVSGVFTTNISGATISGDAGLFGTISGGLGVFSNVLSVPSGTAGSPSVSFNGDPNTGLYSPGADQVAISTNGTRRLLIDSTGALTLDTGDATINNTRVGRGGGAITSNTALGAAALNANTTGNNSTALGFEALTTNTTGFGNAADGYQALRNNTTGAFNTAIGAVVLKANTTGNTNTAVGYAALTNNTTGENNTCLGATAGQDLTTGSNNTIIGRINGTAGLSGTVIIGAGSTERLRIDSSGRLGLGTSTPELSALLTVNGVGNFGIGSAAGPSISFLGNTNTGLFSPGLNQVALSTNGTGRLFVDGSGRVGLGTSSPLRRLDVVGGGSSQQIYIDSGSGNNTNKYTAISSSQYASGTETEGFCLIGASAGGGSNQIRLGGGLDELNAATEVVFYTTADTVTRTGTERVRIDSSGRLLVGTSSSTGNHTLVLQGNSASSGNEAVLAFRRNAALVAGNNIGVLEFSDNVNYLGARIAAVGDGTWAQGTSHPSRLVFSTTADGASSPTERVRISQNGVVTVKNGAVAEIGTLTDGGTITPDLAANCNFTATISGGSRTLANPSNITAGQTGSIFIIQGAGTGTISWGSYWDFAGGTAPTLTTTSGAVDRVDYVVRTSTSIHTVFTANYS